jgi:hypothetical protein
MPVLRDTAAFIVLTVFVATVGVWTQLLPHLG